MRRLLLFCIALACGCLYAQQADVVDFKQATVEVEIDPFEKEVRGQVVFRFSLLKTTDSIFLDARDMNITAVALNDEKIDFVYDKRHLVLKRDWSPKTDHNLKIQYDCRPKKGMYFLGWDNSAPDEVWTQGQGKYTSNWLPSIDDMNDKIEFDLSVEAPKGYEVIANGKLIDKSELETTNSWSYNMDLPMSSYLVALAIGKYDRQDMKSESGIPLHLYYRQGDSAKVEPTYRYTKQIFDFLEEEIGMAYPWQNYKQVPIHDFLYAGMENTGTTFFSDDFMIDSLSFKDNNYVNINAHELAHQWFGNLVTESSGVHHWLHEGFASYYALLSEQYLFGDLHFYMKLYESAMALETQDLSGKSTSLLNPASNSLTFYEKGAWTLFMLRELVGKDAFRASVKDYLNAFRFKNVETEDFLSFVEINSEQELDAFREVWLISDDFPIDRALDALSQLSPELREYINTDCEVPQSRCHDQLRTTALDEIKIKIIEQRPEMVFTDLFEESWKVRQAIALNMKRIPEELQKQYESLLDDPSYITREAALYNLWVNFPESRADYLGLTRGIMGLPDLNFRLLWLVLSLNTQEYESDAKPGHFSELIEYTSNVYNPSVRIRAFNYLRMMGLCEERCKSNLREAVSHHNWQMSKFAREELEKLNER